MSEPRFVHLMLRVIARDQLKGRFFTSADQTALTREQQTAAILALYQRLTHHECAQAPSVSAGDGAISTVSDLLQSPARGLDLGDFLLFFLHL